MMERLMERKIYKKDSNNKYNVKYITKLLEHYRCHKEIISISNQLFYNNELKFCGGKDTKIAEKLNGLEKNNYPIIFHSTEGSELKEKNSSR